MPKWAEFFKNLRLEYKVVLFFLVVLMLYTLYSFLIKDAPEPVPVTRGAERPAAGRPVEREKASSIEEAVSSERPVVISADDMRRYLDGIKTLDRGIKGAELATEVENPMVWIYMANDGERKDDLAENYCRWLHENGVPASGVTILDEAARAKGRLIEIGESKCI